MADTRRVSDDQPPLIADKMGARQTTIKTMDRTQNNISNIQILRFFAAFWVVFYHSKFFYAPETGFLELPKFLKHIQAAGFVGVDIFFVISGVIMALTTRNLKASAHNGFKFVAVRFSRIYTGWWPLFALYSLGAIIYSQTDNIWFFSSFLLLPIHLPNYIVPVLWTLSFELYFYLFVAILVLFPKKWRIISMVAALIGIAGFTTWSVIEGYFTPARQAETWPFQGFLLSPLIIEFIAGFLLYEWFQRGHLKRALPWAISAALFLMAAVAYQMKIAAPQGIHLEGFFAGPARALLVGGFAFSVVAFAMLSKPWTGRLGNALIQLGDASYAIYLSHILIMKFMAQNLPALGWPGKWQVPTILLLLTAVLVFSMIYHKAIELPFYQWTRKRIDNFFSSSSVRAHAL